MATGKLCCLEHSATSGPLGLTHLHYQTCSVKLSVSVLANLEGNDEHETRKDKFIDKKSFPMLNDNVISCHHPSLFCGEEMVIHEKPTKMILFLDRP